MLGKGDELEARPSEQPLEEIIRYLGPITGNLEKRQRSNTFLEERQTLAIQIG